MAVLVSCRFLRVRVDKPKVVRLAQRILKAVNEEHSELSLDFVGDRKIQRLNHLYRNQNTSTDVLAFSFREAPGPPTHLLGDVVISLPTARRQAKANGHSFDREVTILLIHGILHLCGYDHERNKSEARRMQRKERAILNSLSRVPPFLIADA